eukprot:gene13297-biopygen6537
MLEGPPEPLAARWRPAGGLWRPLAAWLLWRSRLAALAARGGPQWPLAARGGLWRPPGGPWRPVAASWRPVAASWRPRGGLWRPAWRSGGLAERACSVLLICLLSFSCRCGGDLRTERVCCVVFVFVFSCRSAAWRQSCWRPAGGPLRAGTATLAALWRPA